MKHLESNLQKVCVRWFRYEYPKLLIYANANGGARSRTEAAIMQGEGVTAGIPDLTILPDFSFHFPYRRPFYVELKSEKGVITEKQMEMMNRIDKLGYSCHVCRSLDAFIEVCRKELQ